MALNQVGVIHASRGRCREDVIRADPLHLAHELGSDNRLEVRTPRKSFAPLDVRPLHDRCWERNKICDEVTQLFFELALVELVLDLVSHATGGILSLRAELLHDRVVDFLHPGAESLRVQLATLSDVVLCLGANQIHDRPFHLGRHLGVLGRGQIKDALLLI